MMTSALDSGYFAGRPSPSPSGNSMATSASKKSIPRGCGRSSAPGYSPVRSPIAGGSRPRWELGGYSIVAPDGQSGCRRKAVSKSNSRHQPSVPSWRSLGRHIRHYLPSSFRIFSTGKAALPATAQMRFITGSELHRGYLQSWNFTIERQLPGAVTTSVAYVGTQTVRSLADLEIQCRGAGRGHGGEAPESEVWTQRRYVGLEPLSECELSRAAGGVQPACHSWSGSQRRVHVLESHQLYG